MLTVRQALAMEVFAGSRVVAGADGLDREIRWAHPVDIPHASEWVRGGEMLLTTFYGLRDDPEAQKHLCGELAEKGLAGMVVAIGGYLDAVPGAIREAANAAQFPIIEMPWDVPFEDVVRAIWWSCTAGASGPRAASARAASSPSPCPSHSSRSRRPLPIHPRPRARRPRTVEASCGG